MDITRNNATTIIYSEMNDNVLLTNIMFVTINADRSKMRRRDKKKEKKETFITIYYNIGNIMLVSVVIVIILCNCINARLYTIIKTFGNIKQKNGYILLPFFQPQSRIKIKNW